MGEISQNLKIQGLKGEERVNALFDSGATTSYIKKSIAKKIGLANLGDIEFEVANGQIMQGYLSSILVYIKNRFAETQVIVSPKLSEQLILGQNFMQQNDIILNFKHDKIRFGESQPKVRKVYKL